VTKYGIKELAFNPVDNREVGKLDIDSEHHDTRLSEVLEVLYFKVHISVARGRAIKDYDNGGVGSSTHYFEIPRNARRVLKGFSKGQLTDTLNEATGSNASINVIRMPNWLLFGVVRITYHLARVTQ
jgi:hypothetical protein